MSRPRSSLWFNRNFQLLWASQSVSLLGLQVGQLALPLVAVLSLHASGAQIGLLNGLSSLPWLVFGVGIGVYVDRWRKRRSVLAAHLGRALVLAAVPVLAGAGVLAMWQLYAVVVLVGVLTVVFQTAYHAYLPLIVDKFELTEGNAKLAVTDGLARTVGPALAGFVVQVAGGPLTLLIQAGTWLFAGGATAAMRSPEADRSQPPAEGEPRRRVWAEALEGLALLRRSRLLLALSVIDAQYVLGYEILYTVQLIYLTRSLHLSAGTIGVIYTVGSIGGIVGAIAARPLGRLLRPRGALLAGATCRGLGLAVIPLASVAGPAVLALLIGSRVVNALGWTTWDVYQQTVLQARTPDRLRGRVTACTLFLFNGAAAVGGFLGAAIAAAAGTWTTLTIGAAVSLTAIGWATLAPELRTRHHPSIRTLEQGG